MDINASIAQTKLGLKLTPSIVTQRIFHSDDSMTVGHGTNAFNPSITLIADMPISESYFFSTGLGYISKRMNMKLRTSSDNNYQTKSFNIQYVQLPATLKLYTSEIALDKKLYFQLGPVVEVAVHKKEHDGDPSIIEKIQPIDVTLFFGAGMEILLAPQTALLVGINYSRGLVNVVRESDISHDQFVIKNDLYGIDIAVKF